jgi:hypothetical protein
VFLHWDLCIWGHFWLEVLFFYNLSVRVFTMLRQNWVVAGSWCIFLSVELGVGNGSVVKHFTPLCSRHWVWSPVPLVEKKLSYRST